MNVPVILHVPHSSAEIPKDVRPSICLSDEELGDELLKMTDHFTDELFAGHSVPASLAKFPVSRLALDPERFVDDEQEPMVKKGMGVVYIKTSGGRPLRPPGYKPDRAALIAAYYEPHHDCLNLLAGDAIRDAGSCLVIDCHSFPSIPLPYEEDQDKPRPDICIGTDPFHTPARLQETMTSFFESQGLTVSLNMPFSGALVPGGFYRKNRNAHAIMIEVNRALYMDESSGDKSRNFPAVKKLLGKAIETAANAS